MELGNALRQSRPLPPNKNEEVDAIVAALSKDPEVKQNEISSVIVVAEAGDDFPQHIVDKIITLDEDKRALLLDVVGLKCTALQCISLFYFMKI